MSYMVYSAGELQTLSVPNTDTKLFHASSGRYWLNMVTKDYSPGLRSEMHETEADIYVVLEGEADLTLDGEIISPTITSPGQVRGEGMNGGQTFHIVVGDVIVIPEQITHMLDARNSTIVYLVVKENVAKR